MKKDLQTLGKRGFVKQDPKEKSIYKPVPSYLIMVDGWAVQWISWDALEGKWHVESLDGDSEYVKSDKKIFTVYKEVN